jgi:hypothetical protein
MLAFMAALGVIAFLVLLSSGLLALALLAGGAFFVYAFFHYAVWGWWLGPRLRRLAEEDEAAKGLVEN